MIRIKFTDTDRLCLARDNVTFETMQGAPIEGVMSCTITVQPDAIVSATLTVLCAPTDIVANPLLDRTALEYFAASHGLKLVEDKESSLENQLADLKSKGGDEKGG